MSVVFPPPALTLIDDAVAVVFLLPLSLSCAFMTLKLVVTTSSEIDNADMTATTTNMDFIVIGAAKMII
jgi:hypothetical protein